MHKCNITHDSFGLAYTIVCAYVCCGVGGEGNQTYYMYSNDWCVEI